MKKQDYKIVFVLVCAWFSGHSLTQFKICPKSKTDMTASHLKHKITSDIHRLDREGFPFCPSSPDPRHQVPQGTL